MTNYGTRETTDDGRYILRYERQLRHPIEKVWSGSLLWELRPHDDGTRLTLTVTNAIPDEYRESVMAGLHVHLDFLEEGLDGKAVDWPNWPEERWAELNEYYEANIRPIS